MNRAVLAAVASAGGAIAAGTGMYFGLVTGRLTIELGVGRRTRPLGPLEIEIAAPRATVYRVLTAPYAERRPRAMAAKVDVLERTEQAVLAVHRTPVGRRLTAVTVETVTFDPPTRIGFRLLRGPVPLVTETFTLEDHGDRTTLRYHGDLGTDLWRIGQAWGNLVARSWLATVDASMQAAKTESERLAGRGPR